MIYDLTGTWQQITHRCFDNLRRAGEQPASVAFFVQCAMGDLIAARSVRTRETISPADVDQFVRDSTDALLAQRVEISVYVAETVWKAEEARDDDWYMLCMRRSALQVLIDDYPDTPLGSRVAPELPHLDDELRRVGLEQGPVEPRHVVVLPSSHWWWHYPTVDAPPKTPEDRLAALIAEGAQGASSDPAAAARAADQVAELVIELGAQGDAAFARFFDALGRELKTRGATLPPIDQLPAAVAPLIAIFQGAFAIDPSGELDAEATADRFDAALRQTLGTSPRALREQELRDEIRRDAAASVAATMREHGLVPACDLPDDQKPPRDA